jgi:hypothetical protein
MKFIHSWGTHFLPSLQSSTCWWTYLRSFLITHAHLDHCSSLILSAGSFTGSRKTIYAAHQTLKDLEGVFADRIWPNLASWDKDDEPYKLLYSPSVTLLLFAGQLAQAHFSRLSADGNYELVAPRISVRTMPLSHGFSGSGVYESAAFFIRHDPTQKQFLFFGDVEPDSLAERPHTIDVWRAAAPMIPQVLSTVFIECSWQLGRKDSMLYGHLSPEHLAVELEALATEVVLARDKALRLSSTAAHKKTTTNASVPVERLRGALDGLRVRIIHCKDADEHSGPGRRPVSHVICDQIRALVDAQGLGAEILPTDQGTRIGQSHSLPLPWRFSDWPRTFSEIWPLLTTPRSIFWRILTNSESSFDDQCFHTQPLYT